MDVQFIAKAMRQHLHMLNHQQVDNIDAIAIPAVVPQWLEQQSAPPWSPLARSAAKDDDREPNCRKKGAQRFQTARQSASTEMRNAAKAIQLSFDA